MAQLLEQEVEVIIGVYCLRRHSDSQDCEVDKLRLVT